MASAGEKLHPINEDLGGPESFYSKKLSDIATNLPLKIKLIKNSESLNLTCIKTSGDDKYIGVIEQTTINASLASITAILDDIPHYKDLFPDCASVKVVPGTIDGDRFVVLWEQELPLFLPNSKYELTYLVSKPDNKNVIYRYRYKKGGSLLNSDGMVLLTVINSAATLFTEFDFYDAKWGIIPENSIWRESLKGIFLSDVSIKLKAENPAWSYIKVKEEADKLLKTEKENLEHCLKNRQPAAILEKP